MFLLLWCILFVCLYCSCRLGIILLLLASPSGYGTMNIFLINNINQDYFGQLDYLAMLFIAKLSFQVTSLQKNENVSIDNINQSMIYRNLSTFLLGYLLTPLFFKFFKFLIFLIVDQCIVTYYSCTEVYLQSNS